MDFINILVWIFIIAVIATIYFGIRLLISKFTHKNKHYGKKILYSMGTIVAVLAMVEISDIISKSSNTNQTTSNTSASSTTRKKAKISKINNIGSPDSDGDYSVTLHNKSSIEVTGKATPTSEVKLTSDYLNDSNAYSDDHGNFKITLHLNKKKKNTYYISAENSKYDESDIVKVVLSPDTPTMAAKKKQKSSVDTNYHKYLKALAKAPTTTKGALTKAYYDDTNNYTVLILNDAALTQSSNELKTIAKAAWDAGNRLYFEYKPFPSGVVPNMIHVEDSQGNVIAKTSFTGNFKYTGE